jgi:hypothetical protein
VPIQHVVPAPAQRSRLLAAMGRLCDARGWERLVVGPIFEPVAEQFPDRFPRTVGGVRKMLKRLLAYAELSHLDVVLSLFDSNDPHDEIMEDGSLRRLPDHTAAWFAGIHDGVCRFGLDVQQACDPEHLVGVLAHEVAHAYREHHGLAFVDQEAEEQATDLTTIYLGFGIFTVNNTYRYRSMRYLDGLEGGHGWSERAAGYLPPEDMSFLLAAQARCRGMARRELRKLVAYLEVNQRTMFDAALGVIDAEATRVELGIPLPTEWPLSMDADDLAATIISDVMPQEDDDVPLMPEPEAPAEPEAPSGPLIVERVERSHGWSVVALVAIVAFFVGGGFGPFHEDAFWSVVGPLLVVGYFVGQAIRIGECSNCGSRLHRDDDSCWQCHGRVVVHPD